MSALSDAKAHLGEVRRHLGIATPTDAVVADAQTKALDTETLLELAKVEALISIADSLSRMV